MRTPLQDCFSLFSDQIKGMILFLTNYQLFGVPIIGYLLGIAVTALVLDYIFR